MRHTTAERELLSMVETLTEYQNMLLGQQIKVFTDHKNLEYKHFNTERVMRWRLLLEEFGPKLTHVKGVNNVVAEALGRLDMTEEEFSAEMFAGKLVNKEEDFPTGYPLPYKELVFQQKEDQAPQNKFRTQPELHANKPCTFSGKMYELIAKNNKIYVPKYLQHKCAKWHHLTLMHPSEKRLELTTAQHHTRIGPCATCTRACKRCANCAASKKRDKKYGLLPPQPTPETTPWHTSCIDQVLAGPCNVGNPDEPETCIELHCMTMTDPATEFFEVVEIDEKTANVIANWLEVHWLSRCPWPTEVTVDKGSKFAAEVSNTLQNECGVCLRWDFLRKRKSRNFLSSYRK